MNLHEIAERFGLYLAPFNVVVTTERGQFRKPCWSSEGAMSSAPTDCASIVFPGDKILYHTPLRIEATGHVLHEICHAVIGPPIEQCEIESGLMALQWTLIEQLADRPRLHRAAWYDFADYILDGFYTVGDYGENFRDCPFWRRSVRAAVRRGVLSLSGQIQWSVGSAYTRIASRFSKGSDALKKRVPELHHAQDGWRSSWLDHRLADWPTDELAQD